jgi:hypothetical protein
MTGDSSKPLVSSIDKVQTDSSPNSHKYITPKFFLCKKSGWLAMLVARPRAAAGSNLVGIPKKTGHIRNVETYYQRTLAAKNRALTLSEQHEKAKQSVVYSFI